MNKIPFSYAGAMEYNKGKGITEDVFKDYALDKFGVSNNDAKKIFDEIDRNDSGGLREREFDKWTREATDNTTNTDTSTTTTSLTTSVSPNVSTSGGDRGSSLNNIPGVRIGETSRLKRDSDYGGSVNDKLTTNGAKYLLFTESHGTNHRQLGTQDAPKIDGYEVVGGGGSSDKSMFFYKKVRNVDETTVVGNIGSGTVTQVHSDKELGFEARTTDPSYNDSKTLRSPPPNSIGIYAEDEGSKSDRPDRFAKAGFKVFHGAQGSDDKLMIMPKSFTRQETPNGNGAEGFIFEK